MKHTLEIPTDDIMRFTDKYSLGRDKGMGSRHFLRIKVLAGTLTSEQLREIAQMADDYSKGYAEITDRQDIQLHWVQGKDAPEVFTRLEKLGFTTDKCGQAFPGARYGDVRNVVVCPITGVNKNELIDVSPLATQINEFFLGNRNFLDMPKKFKISITGCELCCTKPEIQDLGLFAVKHEGKIGFAALVGGSVGSTQPGPRLAKPLGVFIKPDEVLEVAKTLAEIHRDYSNRESKTKARFKWIVDSWGVERVREKLEEKLGKKLERYELKPKISGEEHIGVQRQKDDHYFINIPLIGGILSSELIRKVANIASKFGSSELRLTPFQNLILINIHKKKVDEALKQLEGTGLPVKGTPLRWTTIGCAADFCGKSIEPYPKQMAKEIVDYLENRFGVTLNDLKLKLLVTGCPNDCGLRAIGNIGLLGVQVKKNESKEFYNIYLGGTLGANASLSELVEKMLKPEQVKTMIEKLVVGCLKEGFKDFGEFCRAHKLEELKLIATE